MNRRTREVVLPKVNLITHSQDIVENAISIWFRSRKKESELIEMFGTVNPKTKDVREWMSKQYATDLSELLRMIFNAKLPMLSHFSMTFDYNDTPVAFREQLVRHISGTTDVYWATTSRIQNLSDFKYHTPPSYPEGSSIKDYYDETMDIIKERYQGLLDLGSTTEDAKFVMPEARLQRLTGTHDIPYLSHIVSGRSQWIAQDIWIPVVASILSEIRENVPNGDLIANMMAVTIDPYKFQGEVDEHERMFGTDPLPPNPLYYNYLVEVKGQVLNPYHTYVKPGSMDKARLMAESFKNIWTGEARDILIRVTEGLYD